MTKTGQEAERQTYGPSLDGRQETQPTDPMNVAQAIQAMWQEQANILNILHDLRGSIEGSDKENEDQQPDLTIPAGNTQQNPDNQQHQSEIDAYRQFLNTVVPDYQSYFAPSAFVTPVKPVPVRAFTTHPFYPMAETYQQLLTSVTATNSTLAPGSSSYYAKNPAMAST